MFERLLWPYFLRAADDGSDGGGGGAAGGGDTGTGGEATGAGGAEGGADGAAGAGAGGEPGGASQVGAGGGQDWQASLEEDVRTALAPKGWKTPNDMGKAYIELEKLSGRRGVPLPGEKATDEDWAAFYKQIPGYPDSPEKYDLAGFKPPEGLPWNTEAQGEIVPELHKLGLTQRQLLGAMQAYAKVQHKHVQNTNKKSAEFAEATLETLKKEWGPKYEDTLAAADGEFKYFFDKDLEAARQLRLVDGTYVLDHPFMSRAFARVAAEFPEDAVRKRHGAVNGGVTPEGAKSEIAAMEKSPDTAKALTDASHPEHKAAVERRSRLYRIAYPERAPQ